MASVGNPPLTQTWRLLGLSVGLNYLALGSLGIINKDIAVRLFCGNAAAESAKKHGDTSAFELVPALMARDFSIGIALTAFHYYNMPRAQAMLILSGMWLCAVDVGMIFRHHGTRLGSAIAAGAGIWGYIGWEILRRAN